MPMTLTAFERMDEVSRVFSTDKRGVAFSAVRPRAAGKSRRAKLLKLADKTSNLRSLVQSPPKGWTEERLRDYVQWAEAVVRSCRGLNAKLEADFDAAYRDAKARFGA